MLRNVNTSTPYLEENLYNRRIFISTRYILNRKEDFWVKNRPTPEAHAKNKSI